MVFAAISIVLLVCLVAIVSFVIRNQKIRHFLKTHPQIPKFLTLGYVVFAGCFVFPISSEPFPLDFQRVYLLIASYGVIASAFAGVFGPNRERLVYVAMFLLTAVGMGCRYLLEYGEVSNTYNFTLFNIVSYLALVPTGTVMAYHRIVGRLKG